MEAFLALAEPTRLKIVELLATGEMSSGEVSSHFHISGPAVSQHLKILRLARLVRVRVEAQRRIYALDPAGLSDVDEWLVRTRKYWTERIPPPLEPAPASSSVTGFQEAPAFAPVHDLLRAPFPEKGA